MDGKIQGVSRKMDEYFGVKRLTLNDWLNDAERPEKLTRKNMEYLGEMKEVSAEIGRISMVTYFLLTRCHVTGVRQMLNSSIKQRRFVKKVIVDLKKYGVTHEYEKAFERDIRKLKNRIEYVYPIIRENVRLTEFYPYFDEVGFERLLDYTMLVSVTDDEEERRLYENAVEWNNRHRKEVDEYIERIRPEVERIEERKKRLKEEAMAEREMKKRAKKAENDEVREIKNNEKRYKQRVRKIEKSFERYYS